MRSRAFHIGLVALSALAVGAFALAIVTGNGAPNVSVGLAPTQAAATATAQQQAQVSATRFAQSNATAATDAQQRPPANWPLPTPTLNPTDASSWQTIMHVESYDSRHSDPFTLSGGNFRVIWSAAPSAPGQESLFSAGVSATGTDQYQVTIIAGVTTTQSGTFDAWVANPTQVQLDITARSMTYDLTVQQHR